MAFRFLRGVLAALILSGCTLAAGAATLPAPRVDDEIDPARSFWNDHVHYGFPVRFADVRDGQGRTWRLAYADLFAGDAAQRDKAPVLVLLHGRGMNSGYWGPLLQAPLDAGWRVVAIDWSHSGKSLPANLDRSVVRSLEDSRTLVHALVVGQLGIGRASYLGHSLGGQLAAGYALRFPEAVERLVLYAPGGLESQQAIERQGFRFDDPALARQPESFLKAWQAGILPSPGATQEAVERSFHVSPRPGSLPYLRREASALSAFIVASRAATLRGNPAERERFAQSFAWETLASLAECRLEDADALPGRIPALKMPALLALGARDPVVTPDNAEPVYLMARSNRSPITIKIYDEAGHFIHTDQPDIFVRDVMQFLTAGRVDGPLYQGAGKAARVPLVELPPEVRRFKERSEAAWAERDIEKIRRAVYHPDFREDGQNARERLENVAPYIGMVSNWQLLVFSVQREGEFLIVETEARNSFGSFPGKVRLKAHAGEWYSYGNQR